MRKIIKDTMTTIAPDANVWKQERNFCTVTGANSVRVTFPATGTVLYTGIFHKGADNKIYIDLSDLIRIYDNGVIKLEDTSSSLTTLTEVDWSVVGLINPTNMLIPNFAEKQTAIDIVPPRLILKDIGIPNAIEFYNFNGSTDGLEFFPPLSSANLARSLNVPVGTIQMSGVYRDEYFSRHITMLDECKKYACVQWVSRSGVNKRATWEVRKVTHNVINDYEIERYDNAYDVRKGQQVSMQLVLEDLNEYDRWYYSDIITSNDVRVTFDDDDYDSELGTINERCKVAVTDKKIQQLDGNADHYTLIININYRRYDTI